MIRNAEQFGAAMRAARRGMGLTQADLAERCGVGKNFVIELEGGKPSCQLDKALTVAIELGFLLPDRPGPPAAAAPGGPADDAEDELGHIPRF